MDLPTRLIVDTSVLLASPKLEDLDFEVLRGAIESGIAELLVPRVVLEEFDAKILEETTATVAKAHELEASLRRLVPSATVVVGGIGDAATRDGLSPTRAKLAAMKARTLPLPANHDAVFARALSKRPPFSPSGRGYKDALIWEAVLAELRTGSTPVAFVTRDSDFSDVKGGGLSRVLADEAAQIQPATLKFFRSLSEFVSTCITPAMCELKDLGTRFALESDGVGSKLRATAYELISAVQITAILAAGSEPGLLPSARLGSAVVRDLDRVEVRRVNAGTVTCDVSASLDLAIEGSIVGMTDLFGRFTGGNVMTSALVPVRREVELQLTFGALVDLAKERVLSAEPRSLCGKGVTVDLRRGSADASQQSWPCASCGSAHSVPASPGSAICAGCAEKSRPLVSVLL